MADVTKAQWEKVIQRAELISVIPRKICAKRTGSLDRINQGDKEVDITLTGKHAISDDGRAIFIVVGFRTTLINEEDNFECEGEFEIVYGFEPPLTKSLHKAADKFAQHNGVFNAWPYFRSTLQTLSTNLGIHGMTLPLFKPGTVKITPSKGRKKRKKV